MKKKITLFSLISFVLCANAQQYFTPVLKNPKQFTTIKSTSKNINQQGEEELKLDSQFFDIPSAHQGRSKTLSNAVDKLSISQYVSKSTCDAIIVFPFTEGFESGAVSECCSLEFVNGNKYWSVGTGSNGRGNITAAHTGTINARFYNTGEVAYITKLITPKMNITGLANPRLTFWHGQESWEGDQDELRIYYKASETDSWVLLAEYTYNIPAWTEEIITLPDASNEYYIAFEGTSNWGRGIVLDDIRIEDAPMLDVTVTDILKPKRGSNLTATETIEVVIKNKGIQTVSNIPISLEINGTLLATEIVAASIPSLETRKYTFSTTADLSSIQTYSIKVYTSLADDEDTTNDTLSISVKNDGNVAVMGLASTVTSCNISFVDDGEDGDYKVTGGNQIITFMPTNIGNRARVTFNELVTVMEDFGSYDALYVLNGSFSDINDATEKDVLGAFAGDYTNNLPECITSESTDGALTFYFDRGNWFELTASGWNADITCITPPSADAQVTKITAPKAGPLTEIEKITVSIRNYGGQPISNIPVACNVNGVILTAIIQETLEPLASANKTFMVDLSTTGFYEIEAYTQMPGDANLLNDTLKTSTTCVSSASIIWDFEQGIPNNFKLATLDNGIIDDEISHFFQNNEAWVIFEGIEGALTPIGTKCAISASYFTDYAVPADRWMITPAIKLYANTSLQWDASASTPKHRDGYLVKISTTNNNPESFTTTLFSIKPEEISWTNHSVDLHSYIGQTVYIAFVQNSRDKYLIMLDNIKILGDAEIITSDIKNNKPILTVYPNPTRGELTIGNTQWEGKNPVIELFDLSGVLIKTIDATGSITQINISGLQAGIYLLKMGNTVRKVIKQ